MAAIIGTDEEEPQQQEPIKWNLLNKVKSTVDVLLASRNTNVWSTYGGLSRILDDLEGIFRHGLKHCNVSLKRKLILFPLHLLAILQYILSNCYLNKEIKPGSY